MIRSSPRFLAPDLYNVRPSRLMREFRSFFPLPSLSSPFTPPCDFPNSFPLDRDSSFPFFQAPGLQGRVSIGGIALADHSIHAEVAIRS